MATDKEKQAERIGSLFDDGVSEYRKAAGALCDAAAAKVSADTAKAKADKAYLDAIKAEREAWDSLRSERVTMLAMVDVLVTEPEAKAAA